MKSKVVRPSMDMAGRPCKNKEDWWKSVGGIRHLGKEVFDGTHSRSSLVCKRGDTGDAGESKHPGRLCRGASWQQ